jgi:tetratricopeptide (TPR) repeat protein
MQTAAISPTILAILGFAIPTLIIARPVAAQPAPLSENLQHATQLVRDGKTTEALAAVRKELETNPTSRQAANLLDVLGETRAAREVFQRAIDAASDPGAKAAAQRSMAMSYAFDADCANTIKYEEQVIEHWKTREQADPQNAFYQQGEMANEAARVCIDAGDLDAAERMYRRGSELGLKEPDNQTHPRSLWDYRLAHALARIAARRGNAAEAKTQVDAARKALDGDPKMAEQQERFFPYLVGYVALYTNDLPTAETQLTKALQSRGNENDPFMHALLGMTYEKLGQAAKAKEIYEKAYTLATSHNPPAAFTRRFAREKVSATQ